jgi:hypothetical protein
MKLVAPLAAFGRGDLALAGGKGANLGELLRAAFETVTVPEALGQARPSAPMSWPPAVLSDPTSLRIPV